jgi:hypothetical protein
VTWTSCEPAAAGCHMLWRCAESVEDADCHLARLPRVSQINDVQLFVICTSHNHHYHCMCWDGQPLQYNGQLVTGATPALWHAYVFRLSRLAGYCYDSAGNGTRMMGNRKVENVPKLWGHPPQMLCQHLCSITASQPYSVLSYPANCQVCASIHHLKGEGSKKHQTQHLSNCLL